MKKCLVAVLITGFLIGSPVIAQSSAGDGPALILEYADALEELFAFDPQGEEYDIPSLGWEYGAGDRLETRYTSAEFRLDPSGSIIRMGENTVFMIQNLPVSEDTDLYRFRIGDGIARIVAAQRKDRRYLFETPSAVNGVRGTDFLLSVTDGIEELVVLEGMIEVFKNDQAEAILVSRGQWLNLSLPEAAPGNFSEEDRQLFLRENGFKKLDPLTVPGSALPVSPPPSSTGEEKIGEEEKDAGVSEESATRVPERTVDKVVVKPVEAHSGVEAIFFQTALLSGMPLGTFGELAAPGWGASLNVQAAGFPAAFLRWGVGIDYLRYGEAETEVQKISQLGLFGKISLPVPLGLLEITPFVQAGLEYNSITFSADFVDLADEEGWAPLAEAGAELGITLSPWIIRLGGSYHLSWEGTLLSSFRISLGGGYEYSAGGKTND